MVHTTQDTVNHTISLQFYCMITSSQSATLHMCVRVLPWFVWSRPPTLHNLLAVVSLVPVLSGNRAMLHYTEEHCFVYCNTRMLWHQLVQLIVLILKLPMKLTINNTSQTTLYNCHTWVNTTTCAIFIAINNHTRRLENINLYVLTFSFVRDCLATNLE